MGVAVGIDYGIKRTGIAITDFDQIIASPYKTISTHRLDEFIQGIISNTKIVFLPFSFFGLRDFFIKY